MAKRRGYKWTGTPDRLDLEVNGTKAASFLPGGRITEYLTVTDDNSQHLTIAAADILKGVNVHTSTAGGGNATTDTAANIISGIPLTEDGQCIKSYYINDGTQIVTFVAGDGNVTIADDGNTVLTNEAAILIWRRTSSTAVTLYVVSS